MNVKSQSELDIGGHETCFDQNIIPIYLTKNASNFFLVFLGLTRKCNLEIRDASKKKPESRPFGQCH